GAASLSRHRFLLPARRGGHRLSPSPSAPPRPSVSLAGPPAALDEGLAPRERETGNLLAGAREVLGGERHLAGVIRDALPVLGHLEQVVRRRNRGLVLRQERGDLVALQALELALHRALDQPAILAGHRELHLGPEGRRYRDI